MKVERRAYADEDRGLQTTDVGVHPLLLLGHAQAHPHHVRLRAIDEIDHARVFVWRQRAKRWGVGADDL